MVKLPPRRRGDGERDRRDDRAGRRELGRVRKISVRFRPPLLDEVGLLPALRAYVDAQACAVGLIELSTEGPDETNARLDASREIACFRVVQESLTNAL